MNALLKHLKPYRKFIFIIAILLCSQVVFDLLLPEYTSSIVNVGIQQGGIDSNVMEVIREEEMDKLLLFTDSKDKEYILDNYDLISKNDTKYIDKYPVLKETNIYILDTNYKKELEDIMYKPILMLSSLNGNMDNLGAMNESMSSEQLFEYLSGLSQVELDQMLDKMFDSINKLPDTVQSSIITGYISSEYETIGINLNDYQTSYIVKTGITMLLIALLSMIITISVSFLGAKVSSKLAYNLRNKVFAKVLSFSNIEMNKFSTATLITRSTNDISQIQNILTMLMRVLFYAPFMAIGGILKVFKTNTSMAWIIFMSIAIIITLVIILFSIVIPKFTKIQKLVDRLNAVMREILTGLPVIRAFARHKYEEKRFDEANSNLMKTSLFINRVMSCLMPLMMFILNGIAILIVWIGASSIDMGSMQVGDLMAFIQYTTEIIMSFFMISMISITLPRAAISAKRIDEILLCDLSIKEPLVPEKFDKNKRGYVEFKNVCFRYPDADYDVITDISFTAKPGETTAFIGSTGSGKSTLINLIPRFFDVTEGKILINGVDIRNISEHTLHNEIGYVPQKGVLFSGTIKSNLKYGDSSISDEQVLEAIKISQSEKFIKEKKDGIDSSIAQGGTNVSGGQKQRLSIARAIASNPNIYIFDDSFSALDFKTDAKLRKELKKITSDKTVLIVAQRINTIMNADQIIVLDEGKIVGIGTHKELINNCDIYKQIALSQLSKEEI